MSPSIVIVDDDTVFQTVASALLTARGFDVVGHASDSVRASALVAAQNPDAVLLDVQLADENGWDVAISLRQAAPDMKILMTSAADQDAHTVRLLTAGVAAFIRKEDLPDADLLSLLSL